MSLFVVVEFLNKESYLQTLLYLCNMWFSSLVFVLVLESILQTILTEKFCIDDFDDFRFQFWL